MAPNAAAPAGRQGFSVSIILPTAGFPQRPGDFFHVKKLHFGQKAVMNLIFFV
ncbi:hypothetical protein SUBVAR_07181 [Subdoligranulum variabile DSM 15176]|uniref:Uncharacterized protein n=1 Tax=Subdoligranulum variabile DSM 15176 TaxID=411471 RepID=D1PRZ8_9FIRM|nr:hypothetical protein SUBVAR_07181 [Subdoligranulum variabile DSM 15176]